MFRGLLLVGEKRVLIRPRTCMISVNISDIQEIEVMDARVQITLVLMWKLQPVMLLRNLIVLQWWI